MTGRQKRTVTISRSGQRHASTGAWLNCWFSLNRVDCNTCCLFDAYIHVQKDSFGQVRAFKHHHNVFRHLLSVCHQSLHNKIPFGCIFANIYDHRTLPLPVRRLPEDVAGSLDLRRLRIFGDEDLPRGRVRGRIQAKRDVVSDNNKLAVCKDRCKLTISYSMLFDALGWHFEVEDEIVSFTLLHRITLRCLARDAPPRTLTEAAFLLRRGPNASLPFERCSCC
mmetsp:Transcript_41339/g.69155  ORF Transcript_41339/g.69155 Transcript_41339/m.69155 type:complete len:223 (+) Transcript_41339:155-823(+)